MARKVIKNAVTFVAKPHIKRPNESGRAKMYRGAGPMIEAVKHDGEKVRLDLLPFDAVAEIAKVMTFGAAKYGERNWEKGFRWGRLLGACLRHLLAWGRREAADPETGVSHLAHAGCCILFLLAHELRGLGEDDRA